MLRRNADSGIAHYQAHLALRGVLSLPTDCGTALDQAVATLEKSMKAARDTGETFRRRWQALRSGDQTAVGEAWDALSKGDESDRHALAAEVDLRGPFHPRVIDDERAIPHPEDQIDQVRGLPSLREPHGIPQLRLEPAGLQRVERREDVVRPQEQVEVLRVAPCAGVRVGGERAREQERDSRRVEEGDRQSKEPLLLRAHDLEPLARRRIRENRPLASPVRLSVLR